MPSPISKNSRMKLRATVICETEAGDLAIMRVAVAEGTDPVLRAAALLVRQDSKLSRVLCIYHGWPQFFHMETEFASQWEWANAPNFVDDKTLAEDIALRTPTKRRS